MNAPNYTPLPDALLDLLPEMGEEEARVMLALARRRCAWPFPETPPSVPELQLMTGLESWRVKLGIDQVYARGVWIEFLESLQERPAPRVPEPPTYIERRRKQFSAKAARVRPRILARDGEMCRHCGSVENLCIDHVIPIALGGSDDDDNLQVLCRPCNSRKGARMPR